MWPTNYTLLDNHKNGYVWKIRLDRGSSSWSVCAGCNFTSCHAAYSPTQLILSFKRTVRCWPVCSRHEGRQDHSGCCTRVFRPSTSRCATDWSKQCVSHLQRGGSFTTWFSLDWIGFTSSNIFPPSMPPPLLIIFHHSSHTFSASFV